MNSSGNELSRSVLFKIHSLHFYSLLGVELLIQKSISALSLRILILIPEISETYSFGDTANERRRSYQSLLDFDLSNRRTNDPPFLLF